MTCTRSSFVNGSPEIGSVPFSSVGQLRRSSFDQLTNIPLDQRLLVHSPRRLGDDRDSRWRSRNWEGVSSVSRRASSVNLLAQKNIVSCAFFEADVTLQCRLWKWIAGKNNKTRSQRLRSESCFFAGGGSALNTERKYLYQWQTGLHVTICLPITYHPATDHSSYHTIHSSLFTISEIVFDTDRGLAPQLLLGDCLLKSHRCRHGPQAVHQRQCRSR